MEGKNSFLLYTDLIHIVRKMPKEKRGDLLMVILEYVNDLEPNVDDDIVLSLVFEPIKQGLKRDLTKWKKRAVVNAENGKLGGRPKKDETIIEPPIPPKDEKPKKTSTAITKTDSQELIDCKETYNEFIKKRSDGIGAKFDGQQIKALKAIITYVKAQQKDKEAPVKVSLEHIFNSWEKLDDYTKSKTTLSQINQNIQNIIITLRNPQLNGKQKQQSANESFFGELLEGNS